MKVAASTKVEKNRLEKIIETRELKLKRTMSLKRSAETIRTEAAMTIKNILRNYCRYITRALKNNEAAGRVKTRKITTREKMRVDLNQNGQARGVVRVLRTCHLATKLIFHLPRNRNDRTKVKLAVRRRRRQRMRIEKMVAPTHLPTREKEVMKPEHHQILQNRGKHRRLLRRSNRNLQRHREISINNTTITSMLLNKTSTKKM